MKSILTTSIILFLALSGTAQQTLSLSDAIQLGLERNYDIRIQEKTVAVAKNNNSWGEAGRYPRIDFNLAQNNSMQDAIKTATPFQIQDLTISNSIGPGIQLNWTLFNGFKVIIAKNRLERLQEESQGNASVVISNTVQSIILGYYSAYLEKKRVEEFEKQLNLSRDKYVHLKLKKELGGAVTADLLLEQGNYLTDSSNLINQHLRYRNAIRNLNLLLAEENTDKDYLFDAPDTVFEDYDLATLTEMLEEENVDLRKQYLSQAVLQYDTKVRKADKYPLVTFNAGYDYNRSRFDLSNASFPSNEGPSIPGPQDPLTAVSGRYYANFAITFNLFNGGNINRAIQNAIIQEDIGNVRIEKLKSSLTKDLKEAYDTYLIRKRIYEINQLKSKAARQNLEISSEKYKNGTISSFDFRTVQNNALVSSIQEVQSVFDLIDAKLTIMRLTGGIIREYIQLSAIE